MSNHKDWLCSQCGEWHSDHTAATEAKASDDLVERLTRDLPDNMQEAVCPAYMLREAADTITSLRAQLAAAEAKTIERCIRAAETAPMPAYGTNSRMTGRIDAQKAILKALRSLNGASK